MHALEIRMRQIQMTIEGMCCDGCERAVARAIEAVPGARVDAVAVGSATISYDPSRTSPAAIAQAIHAAGYRADAVVPTPAPVPVASSSGCCGGGSGGHRS